MCLVFLTGETSLKITGTEWCAAELLKHAKKRRDVDKLREKGRQSILLKPCTKSLHIAAAKNCQKQIEIEL